MSTLEKAIAIALTAHEGMVDKGGAPYILHPLRIMQQMREPEEMMAAVLHDVVEDGPVPIDKLREEGFSETVISAVESLTRADNESYDDYIERIKSNPVAVKIKLADLNDNLDISRINRLTENDIQRINRYKEAIETLTENSAACIGLKKPYTLYLGDL